MPPKIKKQEEIVIAMSLRISNKIKARLERQAVKNNRSLNAEIITRIQNSFNS